MGHFKECDDKKSKRIFRKWNKKEIKYLKKNYGKIYVKDISKNIKRSEKSIINKAYYLGLSSNLKTKDPIKFTQKQYEFFDGMIASDLHIGKIMDTGALAGVFKYKDFAEFIINYLGLDCNVYRREIKDVRFRNGGTVSYSFKKTNKLFGKEHSRWYDYNPDDDKGNKYIKHIPNDFRFSPISLLAWYLGDGDLSEHGDIKISTNSFERENIEETLIKYLQNNKINAVIYDSKYGPVVKISRKYKDIFLNLIGDCPVKCYSYKWNWNDVNETQMKERAARSLAISLGSRKKFSKKFYVFEKETGTLIGEYDNQVACAEDLGIKCSPISACLLGKRNFHKNFIFKYKM